MLLMQMFSLKSLMKWIGLMISCELTTPTVNQARAKTKPTLKQVSIKSQINIDEIKRYNKKVKTPIMVLNNDQFHKCSQTNPPISVLKRHFISPSHLCTTCCGLLYSQGPTGGGIVTLSRGFPPLASAER